MSDNRRRIVPVVFSLLALIGASTAFQLGPIYFPEGTKEAPPARLAARPEEPAPGGEKPGPDAPAKPEARAKQPEEIATETPAQKVEPRFDIIRIDPEGTSVFAGRAAPSDTVTVLADGKPVGTVTADENGEWSLATEHKLSSADADFGLTTDPARAVPPPDAGGSGSAGTSVASGKPESLPAGRAETVREVTANLIKDLEGLVESARKSTQADASAPSTEVPAAEEAPAKAAVSDVTPPAAAPAPGVVAEGVTAANEPKVAAASPPEPSSPALREPSRTEVREADASPTIKAEAAPQEAKPVPIPVMFVYREATFTDEGRRAAKLLLDYVMLKKYGSIVLTGHADERGSPQLNYDLSKSRLEAVAELLKEGGYQGSVDLLPKGETEPFQGVDRKKFSREELFQLDRRVELRQTR